MPQGRELGDMNAAVWRRVTAAAVDFVTVPSVAAVSYTHLTLPTT